MKTLPLFATLFVTASASAAQVWVAPASQKIRPAVQAPANAPTTAKIAAAQNEFESFHVVVTGANSGMLRAAGLPCRRRCSTAMKWLLPLPKLPCR